MVKGCRSTDTTRHDAAIHRDCGGRTADPGRVFPSQTKKTSQACSSTGVRPRLGAYGRPTNRCNHDVRSCLMDANQVAPPYGRAGGKNLRKSGNALKIKPRRQAFRASSAAGRATRARIRRCGRLRRAKSAVQQRAGRDERIEFANSKGFEQEGVEAGIALCVYCS